MKSNKYPDTATYISGIRPVHPWEYLMKRTYILFVLAFYLYRYYSHLLPHQLHGASMTKILYYPELHLYKFLHLDEWLIEHPLMSIFYSIVLIVVPILLFISPKNRFLSISFIFLQILYHTSCIASMTHAVHFWMGVILLSWIFLPRKEKTFDVVWEGLRYAICIAYVSAFLWKIINGAFFQLDFGEAVFKQNLTTYYFLYPDSFMHSVYAFFLENPYLLNIGTYISFLLEGAFVIGFFSKKYDTFLIISILLLHHFLYLFVDTLFIEWYILILPFIGMKTWTNLNRRFPILNHTFRTK